MKNIAILGLGGWAQNIVKNVQGKSDKAVIKAAWNRTPKKAAEFCAEHDIALAAAPEDILNDPTIDGVVVAGAAHQHAETGLTALNAGKHTMIIKPFALSGAEADTVCKTAADKGLVIALGYDRCFLPAIDELREIATSGALGKIMHAEGNFCVPRYYNMAGAGWKSEDAKNPPGSLADHLLYVLIELLGPVEALSVEARQIVTTVDLSDHATVALRFGGGVTGNLTAIGVTPNYERLQIFGTDGWVEVRDRTRVEFCPKEGERVINEHGPANVLLRQIDAFADAIAGDTPYPVTPAVAANSAACMEAMLTSKETGERVEV